MDRKKLKKREKSKGQSSAAERWKQKARKAEKNV